MAKSKDLEFGGVLGASAMVLCLPLTVYGLTLVCNKESCTLGGVSANIIEGVEFLPDVVTWCILLSWITLQVVFYYNPFSATKTGMPLCTGEKLKYRCSGFSAFVFSVLAFACLCYYEYDVTIVYRHFVRLITATTILSYGLSVYLYLRSINVKQHQLATGGNSGNAIYDFFLGRELNPRLGDFDLKFFCELRPGLIGWFMLDLVFMVQAYQWYGRVPHTLVLVTIFHGLYVADALWNEEAVLTTMDIVHDGFGLMLAFGDLVWVPFLYSLQARYLLEHPEYPSTIWLIALVLLNVLGYWIFRAANSQKNNFRKNPDSMPDARTINTQSGRKLLVSGWWGMCRHPNYTGDLIMAMAWSLTCGFGSILPYFYPIYFLGLLVHRFERDDVACKKKYGHDWKEYCKIVPYKIFPYIY